MCVCGVRPTAVCLEGRGDGDEEAAEVWIRITDGLRLPHENRKRLTEGCEQKAGSQSLAGEGGGAETHIRPTRPHATRPLVLAVAAGNEVALR